MTDTGNQALKMLAKKMDILREDSIQRGRENLKQYIEECISLLDIVERNK